MSLTRWSARLSPPGQALAEPDEKAKIVSTSGGLELSLAAENPPPTLSTGQLDALGITFDGWLYNRKELRNELAVPPEMSNAQLALHAYRRWGDAFLHHLSGAFAFCLWDGASGTALCARDPLGFFPLFYVHDAQRWFFAPSAETLRLHPAVPSTLDRTALALYLLNWNQAITETLYLQIKRVPPGHVLKVQPRRDTHTLSRYWSPLPDGTPPTWLGDDDLEQFPVLMKQAVSRYAQLGQPGIYLSGGLDSGTVATFATDYLSEQQRAPLRAFSLVFDDPEANEAHFQKGLAHALGLPQEVVPIDLTRDPLDAFEASLELNASWPHPLASSFRSIYLSLGRQAAAAGCDFVLTGDGGDEWLALHDILAADLLRSGDVAGLGALWRVVGAAQGLSRMGAAKRVFWDYGLRFLLLDGLAASGRALAPAALEARRARLLNARLPPWLAPDPDVRRDMLERAAQTQTSLERSHYTRAVVGNTLEHPLTVLYMEESYESGRRIGVPILKPFYDPDVVRFLVRMPPHLRAQGGRFKGLLRTVLHQRLPHLGYDKQQKPYATNFFGNMVLGGLQRWGSTSGSMKALHELGVVDSAIISEGIRAILSTGEVQNPKALWTLLCSERWVRSRSGVSVAYERR